MSVTMPYLIRSCEICDQLYLVNSTLTTILKILLVMLTLKSIRITNRRGDDLAFKYRIGNKTNTLDSKVTISRLSGINLSNRKSTKKVKTRELNVQSCSINAIKSDDVY